MSAADMWSDLQELENELREAELRRESPRAFVDFPRLRVRSRVGRADPQTKQDGKTARKGRR